MLIYAVTTSTFFYCSGETELFKINMHQQPWSTITQIVVLQSLTESSLNLKKPNK